MNQHLVSSKEVIARVDNSFNIDYSDYITRAPLWIATALSQMSISCGYIEKAIPLTVEDYKVAIPAYVAKDIKRILGIEYDSYLMMCLNVINPIRLPNIINKGYSSETYLVKNGYITTSIEEGDIVLYADSLPVEYDELRMTIYPLIPDNDVLKDALEWYVMYAILKRGHKHPVYSLDSNNPATNPYIQWNISKKVAKNNLSAMSSDERANLSNLLQSFIINTNNIYTKETTENDMLY